MVAWSVHYTITCRKQRKKLEDIENGKTGVELQVRDSAYEIAGQEIVSSEDEDVRVDWDESNSKSEGEESRFPFPLGWERSIKDMGVHGVGMFEYPRTSSPNPSCVEIAEDRRGKSIDLAFTFEELGGNFGTERNMFVMP